MSCIYSRKELLSPPLLFYIGGKKQYNIFLSGTFVYMNFGSVNRLVLLKVMCVGSVA